MADPITPGLATAFSNTGPTAITPTGATAFDNTAPGTITPGLGSAFDNTAPGAITPALAGAASNDAPSAITPAGATAFSNTAPETVAVVAKTEAWARPTANLASLTTTTGTIDGASLFGTAATRQSRLVLLTAQTTTSENGLYVPGTTGNSVSLSGASYDSPDGEYEKTGLTAGRLYYWAPGSFGTSVANGTNTLTAAGFIAADSSGELTLTGAATEGVDATLKEANLVRADAFDTVADFTAGQTVAVLGTTTRRWFRLDTAPTAMGSSPIVYSQI
jgi:hypothetical protein